MALQCLLTLYLIFFLFYRTQQVFRLSLRLLLGLFNKWNIICEPFLHLNAAGNHRSAKGDSGRRFALATGPAIISRTPLQCQIHQRSENVHKET